MSIPTVDRFPAIPPIPARLMASSDGTSPSDPTLQKLEEELAEGEAYLMAQPGFDQIEKAISAIMSTDETDAFDPRSVISQTKTNRIAKIVEDLVAMMTQIRPFWDYVVGNRKFEQHAAIYGKLATFWYGLRNVALRWSDAIRWYAVAGVGVLHIYWDPEIQDFSVIAEDPRKCVPIAPSSTDSFESCLAVTVKREVPVRYLKERYDVDVQPESDGSALTWLAKVRDTAADVVSPIWKFRKSGTGKAEIARIPTATLKISYRKDFSTNDTGKPVYMGQWKTDRETGEKRPLNNWSYIVQPDEPLYPHRRMIMWVGNKRLYDGPMYYWHGHFPVIKICLNPFPWTWFGKAPIWDCLRLQTSENRLLRVVDDHASQVAQPGAIMDKNNVSRSQYDAFDTRRAGYKIYQNPMAGKGIQVINPPPLDPAIWQHIDWIKKEMEELAGIVDIRQMMNLKQLPSNSTVESILGAMTPAIQMRSQILEAVQREMAMQMAYNFTQFYTLPIRVTILGSNGIVQDDFDYDPGTLLPDFIHDRDYGYNGEITADAILRGPLPRYNRAKEFLRQFTFRVAPGSLLNAAQMERTLIYFQLARAGAIDIITLLEQLNIPNIGVERLPDYVRTILDRLQWQQETGLGMDVNPAGRKASAEAAPRIITKES